VHSNYQVGVESKPERSVAEKQSLAARAVFDLAERQSAENKEFKPRPRYAKASLVEQRRTSTKLPSSFRCTSAPELLCLHSPVALAQAGGEALEGETGLGSGQNSLPFRYRVEEYLWSLIEALFRLH